MVAVDVFFKNPSIIVSVAITKTTLVMEILSKEYPIIFTSRSDIPSNQRKVKDVHGRVYIKAKIDYNTKYGRASTFLGLRYQ